MSRKVFLKRFIQYLFILFIVISTHQVTLNQKQYGDMHYSAAHEVSGLVYGTYEHHHWVPILLTSILLLCLALLFAPIRKSFFKTRSFFIHLLLLQIFLYPIKCKGIFLSQRPSF